MNDLSRPKLPEIDPRHDASRVIRAPRGTVITCKNWLIEAAYRMIQNNLDPDVAERPQDLVVYGGIGRAARDWKCFDAILASLKKLEHAHRFAGLNQQCFIGFEFFQRRKNRIETFPVAGCTANAAINHQ